jgi:GNAT superfamily N-acetyltransferase
VAEVEVAPLTPERWADLEALMAPTDGCGGCWCRWWQQTTHAFRANLGEENHRQMRDEVASASVPPGLIAYAGGRPVGWCRVGPRTSYPRLARSRTLTPPDSRPVWSIVCFYVAPEARGAGVARWLCAAAAEFAALHGAEMLEAYPVSARGRVSPTEAFTGTRRLLAGAGFAPVRQGPGRRELWRRPIPLA